MFHQPDLFEQSRQAASTPDRAALDMAGLIERISNVSTRPRYAFMVLTLIAKAAGKGQQVGPYVVEGNRHIPVRDWLSDALIPLAQRDRRRHAIIEAVQAELSAKGELPADPALAEGAVEQEVRNRVRRSARCNVSRAVSDLVKAGLLRRHYQGYRVDHHNRGAQRQAVYTLASGVRRALPH